MKIFFLHLKLRGYQITREERDLKQQLQFVPSHAWSDTYDNDNKQPIREIREQTSPMLFTTWCDYSPLTV